MNNIHFYAQDSIFRKPFTKLIPKCAKDAKHVVESLTTCTVPTAFFKFIDEQWEIDRDFLTRELLELGTATPETFVDTLVDIIRETDETAEFEPAHMRKLATFAASAQVGSYLTAIADTAAQIAALDLEPCQQPLTIAVQNGAMIAEPPKYCARTRTPVILAITAKPDKDWAALVCELCATLTMAGGAVDQKAYIALPYQAFVWEFSANNWPAKLRTEFELALRNTTIQTNGDHEFHDQIMSEHPIGAHIPKVGGTLLDTAKSIRPDGYKRAFQIFLAGTQALLVNIAADDIAATNQYITERRLKVFVHAPYRVNLCEFDAQSQKCLAQQLTIAVAAGFAGVVVHVGKPGKLSTVPLDVSMAKMRETIAAVLPFATASCPLLLETPAGQGSETLAGGVAEFMNFVAEFADPRFGACVDTCHVNSIKAGIPPGDFIEEVLADETWAPYLKLIHMNDSKTKCGSCLDRHQRVGLGSIAKEQFLKIVSLASIHGVPMLTE